MEGPNITELRAYYRKGHKDPEKWSRNNHEYSATEIYTIRHEETTIAGMKKMVEERSEFEPEGWLKWSILIGVVAGAVFGMYMLWPYLSSILGI